MEWEICPRGKIQPLIEMKRTSLQMSRSHLPPIYIKQLSGVSNLPCAKITAIRKFTIFLKEKI